MAHQINVFLENRPGRLERLTGALTQAGVNIRAITIADQEGFGVIKLLVDAPDKAFDALKEEGFTAYLKDVIAVIMNDRPGGLHEICRALDREGINIEDAYGFVVQELKTALLVVEVEKIPEAEEAIRRAGIRILSDEELYRL
jgi:hypothetical protein